MRKNLKLALALSAVTFLVACSDDHVFFKNYTFEDRVWTSADEKEFRFEIQDTVTRNDFYIHLRNDGDYPYRNLFLFVELQFPNGKKAIDTLECPLASPSGEWYGKGLGDVVDHKIAYKREVIFPIAGEYSINVRQAMRDDTLMGLYDLGFSIE